MNVLTYRSGEINEAKIWKAGTDRPSYRVDFTDGIASSAVTISTAVTGAVNIDDSDVTGSVIDGTTIIGSQVTVALLTAGVGGIAPATDQSQFRLRTTVTLSDARVLVYDSFLLVNAPIYDPETHLPMPPPTASEPKDAADYPGADLGAKINAAVADIGIDNYGEIWIRGATAGDTISTAVVGGYHHVIRFIGGGIYTQSATIDFAHIIGIAKGADLGCVQIVQANNANLPYMLNGIAYKGTCRDVDWDGNKTNNPTAGVGLTSEFTQMYTNVRVHNCQGHEYLMTAFSNPAAGGTVMKTCAGYDGNGSGVRIEGCFDFVTEGYCEFGNNLLYGADLFNAAGARMIHSDFASNRLGGQRISGTTGGFGSGLLIITNHQYGQNYGPDIVIDGYDHVGGGYVATGIIIDDIQFWGGANRTQGLYPAVLLNDCKGVTFGTNNFTSIPGTEYRNAVREVSTGFSQPCQFGGGNLYGDANTYAGVILDLIPDFSVVHASPDRNISNYGELDVVQLGVRGGTRYLGGNFLATNVLQEVFNSSATVGGITASLLLMAYSGVRACVAFDQNGNVGVNTLGIGGAATSDPSIAGRVWSNGGVLVISGAADTPTFLGAAINGTLSIGGVYGAAHLAQFIYNFAGTVGSVTSNLMAIAESAVAALFAFDKSGNLGLAGSLGLGGASVTDPAIAGRVWSNGGVLVISGAADTPSFAGAAVGAGGLYIGGAFGTSNLAEILFNLNVKTSGVFSTLFSFAKSGVGQLAALDTAGNFGVAGTLGATFPTSDPATTGLTWNNGGLVVVSGFNATAARAALGISTLISLFDHFGDSGNTLTGETDLYSDTTAAGQLAVNGDKLAAEYGGVFVSSGTATRDVRIYFGGTSIFDSGALTLSLSAAWTVYVTIIRVSATVVRYMASFTTEGAALAAYTATGEVTGLTLSGTNILKITGQAGGVGAATNDIVAKMGAVAYVPHA